MDKREFRDRWITHPIEVRAAEDGNGINVEGYAAVFNQRADIGGWFFEQIAPGAFTHSLQRGDDVVFLINHDGLPLARTSAGTLTLTQDDHGLRMATTLDGSDPDAQRIIGKMKRGDLSKMSFAFIADVEEWDDTGDQAVRTIKQASLFDVSIVTTPAYDGTDIGLRSLEAARDLAKRTHNFNAARRRRMRMGLTQLGLENG